VLKSTILFLDNLKGVAVQSNVSRPEIGVTTLLCLVVDIAVIKLESTKCRLSIIAVFIKLIRSVAFSKTS
jgi:hypothetical protein